MCKNFIYIYKLATENVNNHRHHFLISGSKDLVIIVNVDDFNETWPALVEPCV